MTTINEKKLFWMQAAVGMLSVIAAIMLVQAMFGVYDQYVAASVRFGADTDAIKEAWTEALVKIISTFAAIGAAVMLTVKDLVIDKIKQWWEGNEK